MNIRLRLIAVILSLTACSTERNQIISDEVDDTTYIWDENSISIRIEEYSWLEYDIGNHKSFAERNREELSSTSLNLLSQLQGTSILAESPRCPAELRDSTDASIFIISIFQSDGSSRNAGAANVELCGTNLTGAILLGIDTVEELHNSIGVDW